MRHASHKLLQIAKDLIDIVDEADKTALNSSVTRETGWKRFDGILFPKPTGVIVVWDKKLGNYYFIDFDNPLHFSHYKKYESDFLYWYRIPKLPSENNN